MFLAKLPHWAFVGWVGLITVLSVVGQQFFEMSAAIGWGVLTLTTLSFYLLTIEQEYVRCEKAGWILMPGGLLTILATWADAQLFLLLVGISLIVYAVVFEVLYRNPSLNQRFLSKKTETVITNTEPQPEQ